MVKRIRRPFMVFFLFFTFCAAFCAAEISVSIRYYDMKIYYLNTDPVLVQITLTNNGPGPFRFKLADERAFSLDFDVRTTTNRPVEMADILVRRRTQSQQVYFREISIEAGESFSFTEDLREYALIKNTGAYVVRAKIYPELYRPEYFRSEISRTGNVPLYINSGAVSVTPPSNTPLREAEQALESNRLALNIRYPLIPGPDGVPLALDVETNAVLVREKLPPDEVVNFLLTARQKEQWERFFLYFDLESLLLRDSYRRRQWQAESEEGREVMLNRYRGELQSRVIDGDIVTIPADFTIERTAYDSDEGTVTVLEYFRNGGYTERKRYIYYLRRRDGIWNIVDYTVTNLGTE